MASVIKGVFDFTLTYPDCGRLLYKDESIWMTGPQFDAPTKYILEITTPGGSSTELEVSAVAANKILPEDLGFGDCFPSGIYCFTAKAGPFVGGTSLTRKAAILCSQYCGLQRAVSGLRPGDEDRRVERVREYLFYAENAAAVGNELLAQDWIDAVDVLLRQLNCECKC